jgi:type IV pilus assembly protein PilN
MIRINLLPHREEARKHRRQQFYSLLGLVALLGGVVWFVGHTLIGQRIDSQESSNDFVKHEIAVLDKEIAEIKRLQEQTQALLSRKQVIEALQGNRAETVHIFNELGKQVPEGVFIRSVKQSGERINLLGYAQSNARVSQLMRNLDASPIFEKPELVEIKAADFNRRRVGDFNLFVSIEKAPAEQPVANPGAKEQKK